MNKFKRFVSLALVLCMVMAFVPVGADAAEASYAYNIVHVDAGRKYFSVDSLKTIIDNAAAAGFNQVELYLSDNQGFRFALEDMTLTTAYGEYDLTPALGDGYSDSTGKAPDGTGRYLTQDEMDEIIAYANDVGIDIVPCINAPGHMGAILEEFSSFRYVKSGTASKSSIDLDNDEAVAFALALTEKYASYFASRGCQFYNVGADEYANDLSSMGFEGMGSALYTKFVQFLNDAADIIIDLGMTPRAFNDGFYYKDYSISIEPNKAYEVCYWSSGWSGYDVAAASTIAQKGHKMINTNGDYYWVLGNSSWQCSASKASQFVATAFQGSTVSNPAGSMFCIWCDNGAADTEANVVSKTAPVIAAFGTAVPAVESLVIPGETVEDVTVSDNGVSVTAPGLTDVTADETEAPAIEGASGILAYEIIPETEDGVYTGEAEVSIPVSGDWSVVRGGVLASDSGQEVLGICGKLENGVFTFDVPHFSTVVVYNVAEAAEDSLIDGGSITLDIGGTTEKTISGANHEDNWSVADDSIVTVTVAGEDAVESTVNYTQAEVTCGNLISSNSTSWVRTDYYYTPDNGANYYPVYAKRSSANNLISTTYTYTWGYSVSDSSSAVTQIGGTQSVSSWYPNTAPSITVYSQSTGAGHDASTTITFEGKYPGTTTVTVGNHVYTVTVNYLTRNVSLAPTNSVSYTQTAPIRGEAAFTVEGVATAEISGDTVTFTGVSEGTTVATVGNTKYTITVKYNTVNVSLVLEGTASYTQNAPIQGEAEFTTEGVAAAEISGNTVTFTGVSEGTTVATVGNTKYTITVAREDLSRVEGLTVEYWITNNRVTAGGATSLTIAAADAYSAGGLELAKLIPASGTKGTSDKVSYWKTTRLDSDHQQTTGSGVNQTTRGTDITHVRYYGGSWAYSSNGLTWTNVADGDQIVAYYMQSTAVTDEVSTEVVDWGEAFGNYWNDANYVLMDYAVKYESGERVPNAFPIDVKTQKFHCSSDSGNVSAGIVALDSATGVYYRNIGNIRAVETAEYDVYMITVTPTSDDAKTYLSEYANSESLGQSDFYAGTEKVVWVDDMANLGDFADSSKHYTSISGDVTFSVGGEPTFAGVEIYNRHGMLVTYYVRAKATEDSLTVHYIDDTAGANGLEFYSYNIAVKEGTTFKTGIALANPWKGNLVNGDVDNYYGRTQYVSADLQTLSQIGAQYLYTDYKCVRVARSDDGKHVYLYYTFNPTAYIVADFSLPLTINAGMLSEALKNATVTEMKFSGSDYTAYGKLTDNGATVTYQPVKVLQGMDYFTLLVESPNADQVVEGAQGQVAFRVYIVPGPTVHYEETFFTVPENAWTAEGSANAGSQETELAGTKSVNYGFTTGYTAAGMSNGTEIISSVTGNTATVTFTGTGIDLYANCDPDCGIVTALIKAVNADGSTSVKRIYQVQTAAAAGTSAITGQQAKESFGLPIVTASGLAYGTYQLELLHSGYGTELGDIRLDGFRVHNTLNDLGSDKYAAGEKNPRYLELRNSVLAASGLTIDEIMGQVYTSEEGLGSGLLLSGNAAIDAADMLKNGPKNELFLLPGASLTFELASGVTAQIGLKAVNGTASYTINGTAAQIATATDMFYHDGLSGKVTIVNGTESNVLSVTKLKTFGAASAAEALAPISEELVTHALVAMGVIEKPEPVNPFVDVPEDSWYFDAVQWAVEKGITNGADATHFLPDALCQRAAVVTMLWRAAGSPEAGTTVNPFVDVPEDSFYYEAVLWAVSSGITNGVDATHFAPYGSCNRAQVVTFLWRANGEPAASAANPFVDVAEDAWYTDAVLWAVENGVTNGMSSTIFGVDSLCNRAQIVTFLYRAAK